MRWILVCFVLLLPMALVAEDEVVVACQPGLEKYYPLVRAVYARLGLTCRFAEMPSERALSSVNSGTVDAEIGRAESLGNLYPAIVYTTEPLIQTGLMGWVVRGSSAGLRDIQDLRKLRVGILRGNKSAEAFTTEQGLVTESVGSVDGLSKMLESRRIDLVLMPDATDARVLDLVGTKVDVGAPQYKVFHLFSQKRRGLVEKWDQALKAMKADGSYRNLLK